MSARDACVCGCRTPRHDGARLTIEQPGVCTCGHYLYLHFRDELEELRDGTPAGP